MQTTPEPTWAEPQKTCSCCKKWRCSFCFPSNTSLKKGTLQKGTPFLGGCFKKGGQGKPLIWGDRLWTHPPKSIASVSWQSDFQGSSALAAAVPPLVTLLKAKTMLAQEQVGFGVVCSIQRGFRRVPEGFRGEFWRLPLCRFEGNPKGTLLSFGKIHLLAAILFKPCPGIVRSLFRQTHGKTWRFRILFWVQPFLVIPKGDDLYWHQC